MHEMSIATELLRELQTVADQNCLSSITSFVVRAGEMRAIVPEALDIAFESLAEGTCAQSATLELQIEPAKARCRACGAEFRPQEDSFLCPRCGQAVAEIIRGNDIMLLSVEGQAEEES